MDVIWKKHNIIPLVDALTKVLEGFSHISSVRAVLRHGLVADIKAGADSINRDIMPVSGHESHRCTTYLALYGGHNDLPNLSSLMTNALVGVERATPKGSPMAGRRRWVD